VVRNILTGIFLWAVVSAAFSADLCTKEKEDDPPLCPLILPKTAKITIAKNAAKSPAETDATISCESFHISENTVRRFLKLAKVIDARYTHTAVLWFPCGASGEVIFSDGRSAYWSMSQYQYGSLSFKDTEDKSTLYCARCKFVPFMGW
jgi:hypothetical protein